MKHKMVAKEFNMKWQQHFFEESHFSGNVVEQRKETHEGINVSLETRKARVIRAELDSDHQPHKGSQSCSNLPTHLSLLLES
jgi:hypothetical protein